MGFAVSVENLSKCYNVRHLQDRGGRHLREDLVRMAGRPLRWLRGEPLEGDSEAFWALRDVNLTVEPGEVVGIVGKNGAGKSTLLKILSRITRPTAGRVRVRGRLSSLLEVGTGFHPELTGRENVFLNGSILGMSRAEVRRKFDAIAAFAEIDQFLDTPVKRYSSGMYVRLAFAVAAHLEPDVLIVDEVLAVGDAAFQKKCLGRMKEAARENRTVLFVSHSMASVAQLCQRAYWLEGGRVRQSGAAEDVAEAYLASVNTDTVPDRRWSYPGDAPGDDRARLLAVRVLQGGRPRAQIDIHAPLQVEMDFLLLREVDNFVVGWSFYDPFGVCLFASCDWRPNHLRPGTYRKQMTVPSHLLAEGRIHALVQMFTFEPRQHSLVLPDALIFDAIEMDDPRAVRGPYRGHWPGVVRVALDWSDCHRCAEGPPNGHE